MVGGMCLWAEFGGCHLPSCALAGTPSLFILTAREAAVWLCAQQEKEWFGEDPASLCHQNLLKLKCSFKEEQGRLPGEGGV